MLTWRWSHSRSHPMQEGQVKRHSLKRNAPAQLPVWRDGRTWLCYHSQQCSWFMEGYSRWERWPKLWRTMNNYVSRTSFVQVTVVAMTGRGIHHKMMFEGLCRIQRQFSPLQSILEQMINSSVCLSACSTVCGTLVDWMRHLELCVLIQNHTQTELPHRLSSSHWGHQRSDQNTPAV